MARKPKKSAKSLKTKIPLDPEEEALLLRCLETPWDDAPILVYADWVQDNNEDERAEFIREGVRTNKLQMILPPSVKDWASKVLPMDVGGNAWRFLRGLPVRFVTERCKSLWWAPQDRYGEEATSVFPDMIWEMVDSIKERLDAIVESGWIFGLQFSSDADLEVPLEGGELVSVLAHPTIAKATVFFLDVDTMDIDDIEAMANSKLLKEMWYLECPLLAPRTKARRLLKSSPNLKNLRFIMSDSTSFY